MKNYIYILFICLSFFSCEEVIDLDLDADAGKIVIDAKILAPEGKCTVLISTSVDYYEEISKTFINNATVKVINLQSKKEYIIPFSEEGSYEGVVDIEYKTSYKLEIEIDGKTYSGESYLHNPAKIKEVSFEENDDDDDNDKKKEIDPRPSYMAVCRFDDIKSVNNYYRCKIYNNGYEAVNAFFLVDDNRDEKDEFKVYLRSRGDDADENLTKLRVGDNIKVELLTLDKATYTYYKMLSSLTTAGGNEPDAPGNPSSNLSNGALGYFGVFHVEKTELEVKID